MAVVGDERQLGESPAPPPPSQELLGCILSSMAGGLVVVDDQRNILLVNRRLVGLTGVPEKELVGEHVSIVLPDAGSYRPAQTGTADEHETWLRCSTGDIPVSLTHSRLDGPTGGHIYVVIDARTRRATEEALRESQAALIAASRRAGMAEVATGVIHEVNNVLTSVNVGLRQLWQNEQRSKLTSLRRTARWLGETEAWAQTSQGKRLPELISALTEALAAEQEHREAELERILNHLMNLRHVVGTQQGRAQSAVVLDTVNPASLLRDCIDLLWDRIRGMGVHVWTIAEPTLQIRSDGHQLRLILRNIIANALDAMQGQESPRTLRLSAQLVQGTATFRIKDSGTGIAEEDLERIFAHGFTTRREGHGFGLHSAANAAIQLGGRLVARSDGPGCGAEFILEVPDHKPLEAQ